MPDIEWEEPLESMVTKFTEFVPDLLWFLVILVVGMFIARLIRKAVVTILAKIKFDHYLDKAGIGGPLESAGFADSGKLLAQLIYYMIGLAVLNAALNVFGSNPISDLLNDFIAWIPKLIVAIIIIIVTGLVATFVRNVMTSVLGANPNAPLMTNLAVAGVWIVGVFAALDQAQFAQDIVDTLFQAIAASLSLILVIKFGVGGIWAARDRFWPKVYDKFGNVNQPHT